MGAAEVSLGAKITQGLSTFCGYIEYGALATGQTIHTTLAGPIANSISGIWAACGTIGGGIVVVIGTVALANLANRVCHQKLSHSKIVNFFIRTLGIALVLLTGAATTAAVGAAVGGVGVAAYAVGAGVSAFTYFYDFHHYAKGPAKGTRVLDKLLPRNV